MSHRAFSSFVDPPDHPVPIPAGWRVALAAGVFFLATAPAFAGGFFEWLFHHDVQVITTTDITPAGALRRPASPSEPIYYVALSVGYHDFGASMAGDKLPVPQAMIRTIAKVLAKDGYLPADNSHPPSQMIVFSWGTMYPYVMPNPWGTNFPDFQLNRTQMIRFLGGDKLGLISRNPDEWGATLYPGLTRFDPDAQAIAEVARGEFYVAALASYEFPMEQPKHPKQLWQTRISCPSAGLVLADTLPTMLAIAAPYIGTPTRRPVWVNASDKFKPDIRLGDPKFEEYLDSGPLPVYEQKAAPDKDKGGSKK
jgi:hypothetical protein